MIRFSLLIILLKSEVFVLRFSTNASCEPFIITSLFGDSTLLCLKPFTSISNAIFIVSTKRTQFPEFTPLNASSNLVIFSRLFCGIRLEYI